MATKQRGQLPPVLSREETRVKPPEEDEAELPPEEPSWDPQRDSTQMLPNTAPVPRGTGVDDATPPVPRKVAPVPLEDPDLQGPDDATRPIPRKNGTRTEMAAPEDSTRQLPRKTGARPALQEEEVDDPTRQIPRKQPLPRPLPQPQEPDDSTRHIPRKTGPRPALQDGEPPVRTPARKSGPLPTVTRAAPVQEAPLPWEAGADELSRLPTRAQPLPPIISGPQQALVYPPEGPPVLVPVNTEPHFLAQAPKVPPIVTQPNYVPPPPAVVAPIVTAPHVLHSGPALSPSAEPPPAEGELRTTFSNKAAMVADLVKATFSRRSYGMAPYRLRIDEPDGPSTAGGLHARQPISLVSNLDSAPPIVVGWVDVAKKESQLRNYGVVKRRHQNRYTSPFDITEEEYDRFLNELVETLFYGGIRILVQVPEEPEPTPAQGVQGTTSAQAQAQPQPAGRSCLGTLFLLSLTFALGMGVGLMNYERFEPWVERVKAMLPGSAEP